ncbi:alpha-(1,3)-fucosyltransferase 4 [Rana temporaria]|uniref:alpha-(1,3)-fucosyltransferase 4 n=1 Tax=Rana temporaria TaxID=8407 RepID=UPI001AAD8235|nr:alpha-(1,3)-fucosyltransferase 4 [Rana temporaria]
MKGDSFMFFPKLRGWRPCWRARWRAVKSQILAASLICTVLFVYACTQDLLQSPVDFSLLWGTSSPPTQVTLLIWYEPFGKLRRLGDCRVLFNITGCHLTTNRSLVQEADTILFHHRDIGDFEDFPFEKRLPSQKWIWMNFESPSHSSWLSSLSGIFNWTMSYRVDSDIFVPYGYLFSRKRSKIILPRKKKLVAWVISNWNEDHERVQYYNQLREYIDIDIFGHYGIDLKQDNIVKTVSEYKFYLAFENSLHTDYITEKLWRNAFKSSAVPIVMGPSRYNYEMFIPRNSFIHVDDFSSPRKLAMYLKYLDKNMHMYRRYFTWRKRYDVHVTSFWDEHYCTACETVKAGGSQHRTVTDLAGWFES